MRRGRGIKVGLRRVDAAIDAMKPFGFPADLVKRKLKELLKTYGDDGWVFIEEASYNLLIEVILEEIQNGEQDESTMKEANVGEQNEYTGAVNSCTANNDMVGVTTSSGTAHVNLILETVHRGTEASGVDKPDEVPNVDNVSSPIGRDAKPSEFQSLQSCDQSAKCTPRRCHGWISYSNDDDVMDTRQFKSHKLASELPGETKNPRVTKTRWDLKPGVF
ncbi:hypothetical protein QQ045_025918 [Rhodiola kirilowii]